MGLCRRRRWDWIVWTVKIRCRRGYWWWMSPPVRGMFYSYLFCWLYCTSTSIGDSLIWRLGKILIKFIHDGGRLCNVFLVGVAMFVQGRTSELLVELRTWWVIWIAELTAWAGLVMPYHFIDTFPRYPPCWWSVHRVESSCGRAGKRLELNGWRVQGWGVGHPVCYDWRCWGWN